MARKQQNAKPAKQPARNTKTKKASPVRKRKRAAKLKITSAASAKPPAKDTRFKPGQSGNPKGRPRKDRSLLKHIEAELDAEMQVTEGGKAARLTKREALAKSMVNKALQGDYKMLTALLKQLPVPKPDESQEHYSVRLETVLRLLARKGKHDDSAEPDGDAAEGSSDDQDPSADFAGPDEGSEEDDQ